ncbi:type II toxin-antitoxin system RelE/ParE family toxin (plasmid) [Deefgea piscis]|jgi:plasmid stabilization system protein ParE|uniref:Type II toxin-antitoxin system RelE/ParE family toxin n=1 Tax=Deefgea piscis TaxID=2739061 RepID=A0A6M8SVZ6_9NEIS|nr:type II toxin-antitoxin system RelE/ParE family toxin [Deefgea piscis]QKJ68304.1 type II toxin-antitoxin system RelE/ParE family toxin [Deefgea piscis]
MPRLIWTPPALIGMQRSYRFLALKNKDAASRAVKAIRAGAQLIAQHPEIGRPAEEMEPEYREWLVDFGDSGYVLLYRFDVEVIAIVSVRHQKEVGY